ncbi:hypothetical protein KIH77_07830 [Bifidobacterium sp. 82T24]|uniref:hypothetical protein n=1 Tax=Bifidobacterium pluvialisilvae TaxID=2834436 RepID=UPI001C59BC42|nr:hypothetical protein [Bifidobacterium pluvialisilvae]MBW3088635.1 hypothetical protein [Bifidobacterium pluvialisilvae]
MDTQTTTTAEAITAAAPPTTPQPTFMDPTTWRPRLDPATLSSIATLSIPPAPLAPPTFASMPSASVPDPMDQRSVMEATEEMPTYAAMGTDGRAKSDSSPNPPLVNVDDVPGGIGMSRLLDEDVLVGLDDECGYMNDHADTLYGRASIANRMVPFGSIAAGPLAAWVWVGGEFPHRLDMISNSRYRTLAHGRQITVYNRKTPPDHVMRLGQLRVTSPLRTICDIACMDEGGKILAGADSLLPMLLERYEVKVETCLQTLWENPRWPNHGGGVHTLMRLRHRRP